MERAEDVDTIFRSLHKPLEIGEAKRHIPGKLRYAATADHFGDPETKEGFQLKHMLLPPESEKDEVTLVRFSPKWRSYPSALSGREPAWHSLDGRMDSSMPR
jgi:hypothetical protein